MKNVSFRLRRWIWFSLFASSNALLSYAPWPLVGKLWIGLFGILLPLGLGFYRPDLFADAPPAILGVEGLPSPFPWLWLLLGAGMLALRSFQPLTFIPWPLNDEAINGYYAMRLDQHWSWVPFFHWSHLPPFFIWLLFFLYKGLGSFLAAIRLEPIFLSFLTLPAAYAAARAFFSKSFSLLYLLLVGFSFWALFFARISHQGGLLVLWEYLALGALGMALKAPAQARQSSWALLGLVLGTGFYTYFAWPLVALWISLIAIASLLKAKERPLPSLLSLFVPVMISGIPLGLRFPLQDYGSYFQTLLSLRKGNDWLLQAQNTSRELASFLWGCGARDFYYGPVWGGFFNPLMGAAFLVGVLELFRARQKPEARAFFLGLPLFFLPAFLTNNLTDVREIQVLPLLTFAAALGCASLVERWKPRPTVVFLGLFLALSTALDVTHLMRFHGFMADLLGKQKTAENAQAFQILNQVQRQSGPGLVLTSFSNDLYTFDRSLEVASYPFNAAENPRLSKADAGWLAVVANAHYEPFLARRYPEAKFVWLSNVASAARDDFNGGLMLMVVPLALGNRPALAAWVETDRRLNEIVAPVMGLPLARGRVEALSLLSRELPALPQDPFLRSCYWDLVYSGLSWENRYDQEDAKAHLPGAVEALQRALKEGYPTAYFYNELGSCYALTGDYAKARWAFEEAVHSPLNLTPAAENLKILQSMRKSDRPGKEPGS